ncbi:hypothetical protein Tco_0102935 [Tanacetum coccineum]
MWSHSSSPSSKYIRLQSTSLRGPTSQVCLHFDLETQNGMSLSALLIDKDIVSAEKLRTPSPPPRKKSLSPPQALSKSISSKSTHYTSSSSPSESPTPTHVAPPPKLCFVILIKLKPQELPPLQVSPNDPYVQTMDNWPLGPTISSPPQCLDHLSVFQIHHPDLNHCHQPNLCLSTLTTTHRSSTTMHLH